ncbi:2-amino-3,7-dideoxy-D-threo-hept-6-ulosonate synthase [Brevibacillus dissolubilis]|uniref:2-amino-3,7-dideoxy-D-threo-hept-6-ulosonate synthase n=1 Tax=Brevibacillus dissolubilis TaxID=1844116 RepID=UPI001117997B|nr:2-amino-3,7-dideoxy-D-threo-hept-6-ulosonate synthase [Brevibacillus dissolubilis]
MEGKVNRLKRLYNHTDKLFVVPMDHGITLGPIPGITDIEQAISAVFDGGADAVVLHKGLVRYYNNILTPASGELIIHVSASTELSPHANRKELVASVEHAVRLGATAISTHTNIGAHTEPEMLKDLGMIAEECDKWGMPLLAMMYVRNGNKQDEFSPTRIALAARVAEELGADLVKVNYTGSPDTFAEVISGVKIPVLIAGGPKMDSTQDVLTMIEDAVRAGANGISIGRNVFQHANPADLSAKIRRILS